MSTIVNIRKKQDVDVVTIKSNPVVGVIALTAFAENLVAGTGSFVDKTFRYSINGGIDWTAEQTFILGNITALSFNSTDVVVFELFYKKNSTASTIDVTSVDFTATDSPTGYDETYFTNSIFFEFFNSSSLDVLNWYVSVLDKLYQKGLLPAYFERKDTLDSNEDFIAFWGAIAKFAGFYVVYVRQFRDFYTVDKLAREYLEQRGLKYSMLNTITELQYLIFHFYKQVANRGTIKIVDDTWVQGSLLTVDGELLRLIDYVHGDVLDVYAEVDEFLFQLEGLEDFGWNLLNSSPLNKRLEIRKPYRIDSNQFVFKCTPSLNYRLNFEPRHNSTIDITFQAKDATGADVDCFSAKDGSVKNSIQVKTQNYAPKRTTVQVILYSSTSVPNASNQTYQNQDYDIILPDNVNTLRIKIAVNTNVATQDIIDETSIYVNRDSFYLSPAFSNYSHGVIQTSKWINSFLINQNKSLLLHQVDQFIRQNLVPYGSHFQRFTNPENQPVVVQ